MTFHDISAGVPFPPSRAGNQAHEPRPRPRPPARAKRAQNRDPAPNWRRCWPQGSSRLRGRPGGGPLSRQRKRRAKPGKGPSRREALPQPLPPSLPDSHISSLLVSSALAARLLPALRPLSSPRPPSRGPSLTRATAAAGGEQAQPLKLPPGPRLGPGSGSGATVGGVRCEVTGPRCVHAVARQAGGERNGTPPNTPEYSAWRERQRRREEPEKEEAAARLHDIA